jgi:transcriptional regulator with XRE-family HTH domain
MITALKSYRTATGQRLEDIAAKLGVDKSTILRWENGDYAIPLKRLAELEKATGIPRSHLRPDVVQMMKGRA